MWLFIIANCLLTLILLVNFIVGVKVVAYCDYKRREDVYDRYRKGNTQYTNRPRDRRDNEQT